MKASSLRTLTFLKMDDSNTRLKRMALRSISVLVQNSVSFKRDNQYSVRRLGEIVLKSSRAFSRLLEHAGSLFLNIQLLNVLSESPDAETPWPVVSYDDLNRVKVLGRGASATVYQSKWKLKCG